MNTIVKKARMWTRNWRRSTARLTIWTLHSLKWEIPDTLGNGELQSYQLSSIFANDSLVSTEVRDIFDQNRNIFSRISRQLCFDRYSLGDLHNEQDVLEWLRKNRYRQPELNIYMYMLIAITILFLMYTGFLLSCFRSEPSAPVAHPKQAWRKNALDTEVTK